MALVAKQLGETALVFMIALCVFATYRATMAPTITWKNGHGGEGAELAAAAYVWGVAHPPGYPLYLTVVRLFQFLPVGDPAYRATLFSASAATAATVLIYLTALALVGALSGEVGWRQRLGATFASMTFAYGTLLWSRAVITEVYTFTTALFAFFLLAVFSWLRRPERRPALVVALSFALLTSHHPTFAVALVPLAGLVWRHRPPKQVLFQVAMLLLICPLLFLTLRLRATLHPPLNWGDASSWSDWLRHVTAADYHPYFLARPLLDELPRVPYATALIVRQSGWLGVILAAFGLAWLWSQQRAFWLVMVSLMAWFFAFGVLYNARDGEVYLLPTIQLVALAAGLGATWMLQVLRPPSCYLVPMALFLSVAWQALTGWSQVDVSQDAEARTWGTALLRDAPPGALVRSSSEEYTFALWYLQAVEGQRPDVAIVDTRLLALPWYRRNVLRQYPQLVGRGIADAP